MNNNRHSNGNDVRREQLGNNQERNSSVPNDLPDSPGDRRELEPKETTIDLPDVKDIPGQEFVNVPSMGELADTTVASAGEEGEGIFEDDDEEDTDDDFNVSADEKNALDRTDYLPTTDEDNLQRASLDSTDFEGEPLNEKGFGETPGDTVSDSDLDIDNEEDESSTSTTEDDEENESYSLGGDDHDDVTDGN